MNCRTLSRLVAGFSLAGLATAGLGAPFSLGELAVVPRVVPVGAATTVTATIRITDPSYIAGSAALFSTDPNGKLLTRLALFVDDGTTGDRVAGDGVFTGRWVVNQSAPGTTNVIATAAFRGTLLRVSSDPERIESSTSADLNIPKASIEGDLLVFRDAQGRSVREIRAKAQEDRLVGGELQRTVREVVTSYDQSRAGIFEFEGVAPRDSQEVLEYSWISAKLTWYSGPQGEMASITPPGGKSFFLSNSQWLVSRTGHRIAAVAVDEAETDPEFLVYDEWGRLLYQSRERFGVVRAASLSQDGRLLAYLVLRSGAFGPETVFRVVTVDTGKEQERVFDERAVESYYFLPTSQGGFALYLDGLLTVSYP